MEYPPNQSSWRRGWNDTKTAWTSWQFLVFDVVVAGIVGGYFGWYWGLILVTFSLLGVWFGATTLAPYKQRNEARILLMAKPKSVFLPNRDMLLRTIAEARMATIEWMENIEALKQQEEGKGNYIYFNEEIPIKLNKIRERFRYACEALEKEILVAGSDYETILKQLYMFMQASAILNASPVPNQGSLLTYKYKLEELVTATRNKIDEISQ